MDNGYIVRFMRSDDLPDEEYSHCSDAEALSDEEREIVSKIGCNEQFDTCLRLKEILPLLSDDSIKESAITARIKIENISPAKFPIFFDLLRRQAVT